MDRDVFEFYQRPWRKSLVNGIWIGLVLGVALAIAVQLLITFFNGGL